MDFLKDECVEVVSLPCHTCGGDCCGASTPFTESEIKAIKKVYPHKLKRLKAVQVVENAFALVRKGRRLDVAAKCEFYDDGCTIYDVRPKICKDFGEKLYAPCPFNGLECMPKSKEEQKKLTLESQSNSFAYMQGKMLKFRGD